MALNNSMLIHQFKRKDYEYNINDYLKADRTFDRAALLRDARKVAKANNQRLLRLEQAGMTSSPAYQGAVKALSGVYDKTGSVAYGRVDKSGRPRYKERVDKLSNEQLRRMLYAASKTSQAKTSTTGGVNKLYSQGLENLNKMLGDLGNTKLTVNDVMLIFRDEAFSAAIKQFGYQAILQAASDMQDKNKGKSHTDTLGRMSAEIADIMAEWGKSPGNLLKLRERLGLTIPKYDPNKWETNL